MRLANDNEISEGNRDLKQNPYIFEELVPAGNESSFILTGSKVDYIKR